MKTVLAGLAFAAALILSPFLATPAAAQPCQWNYSAPGNVSTATYCGNVVVKGSIFSPGAFYAPTSTIAVLRAYGALSTIIGFAYVTSVQNEYTWSPASTQTDDGYFVVAATGVATGRWINNIVSASSIASSIITVANQSVRGYGLQAPLSNENFVLGFGSELSGVNIQTAAQFGVVVNSPNVSKVSVHNAAINSSTGEGAGTTIAATSLNGFAFQNNYVNVPSYGFAWTGGTDTAGTNLNISGNSFYTGNFGDGIELDNPGAGFVGALIVDNYISNTGEFCIGSAATEDVTIMGNVCEGPSPNEMIHIEDTFKNVAVIGNVGRGGLDGIRIAPVSTGTQTPAAIIGNALSSITFLANTGINNFFTAPNSVSGFPMVGNVLTNYAFGISQGAANGPIVLNRVDDNSIWNCTAAIQNHGNSTGASVMSGTNYAHGCVSLYTVLSGLGNAYFPKVMSDTTPSHVFLTPAYAGVMPASTNEGFAFKPAAYTTAAGTHLYPLWPDQVGQASGRILFSSTGTSGTNWFRYVSNILWDGTTLTITNPLVKCGAGVTITCTTAAITIVQSGGSLFLQLTDSGASSYPSSWMDFTGFMSDVAN